MMGFSVGGMELAFTNRQQELKELDAVARSGGLLVVFGRRRVGKSRLLLHWLKKKKGLYTQAIEAARDVQLVQVFQDIRESLGLTVQPKSWLELLDLLKLHRARLLCLDEFPYLVASDPSLPSILQRWLDHEKPPGFLLILSGSSKRMMNDLFLNRAAPLYGRARKILEVSPMSYAAFCHACRLPVDDPASFNRFSLVGGIPKYWEFVNPKHSPVQLADELFFGFAPYLEQEPQRTLSDEGVHGLTPLSLLEVIGRGASKPSEMASRIGTAQTNLNRILQMLLDAAILHRELPFGESIRSTKKTLYRIQDPTIRFWFRVYSPHRTRWNSLTLQEKNHLIHDHASTVFEDACRQQFPDAARYWERDIEFDFIREQRSGSSKPVVVVTEVKWKNLSSRERAVVEQDLRAHWNTCQLAQRHPQARFEVLDASYLGQLK